LVVGSSPTSGANFISPSLQPCLQALEQMTPANQQIIVNLIQGLAERDGITISRTSAPGLQLPEEGIPLWVTSLKANQYSSRTIEEYRFVVTNYLKHDPCPTFLSIQQYLADRLDKVAATTVAMERKGLRSFFRFLHSAGLWQTDQTANIRAIKVRYCEREVPSETDIAKLLKAECYQKRYTQRFRLIIILLLDTGLRVTEACSIKKGNINFDKLEIKVLGKGNKERLVPISPLTASLLRAWIECDGQSQWLFPADNAWGYWDKVSVEKMLKRACKRCGIKPIKPHALRHYFATCSLKNGARLEVISKMLGHASVQVTGDVYAHIDNEDIHTTHRKFSPLAKLRLGAGQLGINPNGGAIY